MDQSIPWDRLVSLIEHNDVVLCSSDVRVIEIGFEHGDVTRTMTLDLLRDHKDWAKTRNCFFTFSHNNLMLIYGVYRLSIMHEYNSYGQLGFRGALICGESSILSKVALHGRIVALPHVLRTYRMRHDSSAAEDNIHTRHLLRIFNVIYVSYNYHFLVVASSKLTIRQKLGAFLKMFFCDLQTIIHTTWTCLPGRWRWSLLSVKCLHALRDRIVH
jgi:hypothetical protein